MARIVGRKKPTDVNKLTAAMGSDKFRQVSAADLDKKKDGTEGPPAPSDGDVTRTNRSTGETTTTSSDGSRTSRGREAPIQGPVLGGDTTAAGSQFDAGLMAAMGTGSSELGTSWGIAPNANAELMEPGNFNAVYEAMNGNNPLTSKADQDMYSAQQGLMMNFGGWNGNEIDDMGARYDQAGTVGGKYMTVGDVMNVVYGGGNDKDGIFKDDDGKMLNNYLLRAIQENYSGQVLNAVDARLTQAQEEYQVALVTGQFQGTYPEWLQQSGDAEWLGAFQ